MDGICKQAVQVCIIFRFFLILKGKLIWISSWTEFLPCLQEFQITNYIDVINLLFIWQENITK